MGNRSESLPQPWAERTADGRAKGEEDVTDHKTQKHVSQRRVTAAKETMKAQVMWAMGPWGQEAARLLQPGDQEGRGLGNGERVRKWGEHDVEGVFFCS